MTALKHIFLLIVFFAPLSCSKEEDVRGGRLDVEIDDISGLWILEDGFDRNVNIDNGDSIEPYVLPVQLNIMAERLFEDGYGNIQDWGLEVPELIFRGISGISIDETGDLGGEPAIVSGGMFQMLMFYRSHNKVSLKLRMVTVNTGDRYEWSHIGTYKKQTEQGVAPDG